MLGNRCWLEVDLDAIEENIRELRGGVAGRARFMATVKADGYGHGAVRAARAAVSAGADFLGIATVDEALELAGSGVDLPLLVLGWTPPERQLEAVKTGIRMTVSSLAEARSVSAAGRAAGRKALVHVKVDTGMGRLGMRPGEPAAREVADMSGLDWLAIEGLFTHFACADEPDKTSAGEQLAAFHETASLVEKAVGPVIKHAANTAAILDLSGSHLDMVRAGIGIYGLYPSGHVSRRIPLRPAMSWKTRAAMVKTVPAGTPISYGHTYRTRSDATILTLSVGYADGYFRLLGGRAEVLVGGQRLPVVGRVCMDQCMVEAPESFPARAGAEVVLMGRQAGESISAEELALWSGTINYEVVTTIGRRVPRIYIRGGRPSGVSRALSKEESL